MCHHCLLPPKISHDSQVLELRCSGETLYIYVLYNIGDMTVNSGMPEKWKVLGRNGALIWAQRHIPVVPATWEGRTVFKSTNLRRV